MIFTLWFLVCIALLTAVAFFSGSEMGLYSLNRVRLRLRAEGHDSKNAKLLIEMSNQRDQAVMTILLLQNLCAYFLTVAMDYALLNVWGAHTRNVEWYSALLLSPMIFVLGDVVPKNWLRQEADHLMYPAAPVLDWSMRALRFTGIPWFLGQASRLIARWVGQDEQAEWLGDRGEVLGLLREGAAEVLSEEQTQIVERVLAFSRVRVRSIMLPRRRVIAVPTDVDRKTFEHTVRLHAYSRLPVLDTDGRTAVGVVSVADVLADDVFDLSKHLQRPLVLRSGETATAALVRLQKAGTAMAIVTEGRHSFLGIVTLKDIVEEIFGELPAW
jgi:magnesium and cobalt exporter, CNNM family